MMECSSWCAASGKTAKAASYHENWKGICLKLQEMKENDQILQQKAILKQYFRFTATQADVCFSRWL